MAITAVAAGHCDLSCFSSSGVFFPGKHGVVVVVVCFSKSGLFLCAHQWFWASAVVVVVVVVVCFSTRDMHDRSLFLN